ncbi:hypothetical protein NLG97_g3541 [Lecanicillium saksenae]|uniref:Uncharacterized protein n=1 Tax=Lecanicillium saksenae TaxID=468837 RepID=A0ACC1QZJ1_9HYPO|nr:hypothetical protein NLG97_g3541 [Lecanicillium saksenae]
MVRSGQSWELGEPDLNDRGQPVVHNIAEKLGCIRPNCNIDLSPYAVFAADEAVMAELARQFEEQQPHDHESSANDTTGTICATDSYSQDDGASSSELKHSIPKQDYRKTTFGSHNALSLSPRSLTSGSDLEFSTASVVVNNGAFFSKPTTMLGFSSSCASVPATQCQQEPQQQQAAMSMPSMQPSLLHNLVEMNQNDLDADSTATRPDVLSYTNLDIMMGMADPIVNAGFDNKQYLSASGFRGKPPC